MAPNRNIIEAQFIPPQIEHGLIEAQDSLLRDPGWRRREFSQPFVDDRSLSVIDARQQMPYRERVAFARSLEHNCDVDSTLLRRAVLKVELFLEPHETTATHPRSKGCPGQPSAGSRMQLPPE